MISINLENNSAGSDPVSEKDAALGFIRAIRDQVAVLGRNDSEFSDLHNIETKLLGGIISPEEAKIAAQAIYDRKQEH